MKEEMMNGADGSVLSDRYVNAVHWEISQKQKTITLANLQGFALSLESDNTADVPAMNTAALAYLRKRFTGPSIRIKCHNWLNEHASAFQVWTKIDKHYGLQSSAGTSQIAKSSLSESVLQTLRAAAPACYNVFETSKQLVYTDDASNENAVNEATDMPHYFSTLLDQLTQHTFLAAKLLHLLVATDKDKRVTEQKLLDNLRENSTLMSFRYLSHDDLQTLRTATLLNTEKPDEFQSAFINIFKASYECNKMRKGHQENRATSSEAAIAAIPSSYQNKKPIVTNTQGKSFRDLPNNGCAYHYFSTSRGCRFGQRCKKSHAGLYGSLGPFPYSTTTRHPHQLNPPSTQHPNQLNRPYKPRKDVMQCAFLPQARSQRRRLL
jgi:hypothetical protein